MDTYPKYVYVGVYIFVDEEGYDDEYYMLFDGASSIEEAEAMETQYLPEDWEPADEIRRVKIKGPAHYEHIKEICDIPW